MDWRAVAKLRNKFNASHDDVAAIIWRNEWCRQVGPHRPSTSPT